MPTPRDLAHLHPTNVAKLDAHDAAGLRRAPDSSPGRGRALTLNPSGYERRVAPDISGGPDSLPYDAQAGCPVTLSGGTYAPNVRGMAPTPPAPAPNPFRLK